MCGIIGVFNQEGAVEATLTGMTCIKHRGGDGCGICTDDTRIEAVDVATLKDEVAQQKMSGTSALGHVLHSTVGHVLEPFVGKNRFVMNGEIYNWKEIDAHYGHSSRNDAHAFFQAWEQEGEKCLARLDGDFAFVAWQEDALIFGRDVIGVKPLWYYQNGKELIIASERKAIVERGVELNAIMEATPHKIYRFKDGEMEVEDHPFFDVEEVDRPKEEYIKELASLIEKAVKKRAQPRVGVMFSGGIDSVTIAYIAKKAGFDVRLYTAAFEDGNTKESEDLQWARRAAEWLDLPLTETIASIEDTEEAAARIVHAIEEADAIKVGVALPFFFCGKAGCKDGLVILLSGLGSEEIFGGYERHAQAEDINAECLHGLKWIHERDLYRDDVVMLANHVAGRFPFLDKKLIEYALTIPSKYKIVDGVKKVILREMAESIGIPKDFAWRKKRAAQYGSNFDKALAKCAKKNGFKLKKDYLQSLQ